MRTSESTSNVFAALAKAQGALEPAIKDSNNPAFKSKYADLTAHVEAIRPVFKANDLAILQELTSDDSGVQVTTRIVHKSGEWAESGPFFMPATKHDAHGFGSACSYARRYHLSAFVGTVSDDDDGNAAVASRPMPAAQMKAPDGFDDWWDDMVAVSDEGLPALEKAFQSTARKDIKAYAVGARREQWAALKKHAEKATVAQ
jgi:hypothetical protein